MYDEYLQYGGFPGVVVEEDFAQKELILTDIFKSYYEKDIKGLFDFRDLNAVRDLILLLTQRIDPGLISPRYLLNLVSQEKRFIPTFPSLKPPISSVQSPPFSKNVDREISGGNKVYLCDTGILNRISNVSDGTIFENAVFEQFKKYGTINYYQKRKSEKEIDFIINKK